MGSYDENTVAAKATSAWYQLPPRTPDRPLVTVAAAGAIWYYDEEGAFNYGQSLKLQWGVHRPDGVPGARTRSSRSTSSCKRPGATCVSRWPGRRRKPTSRASSPTTPTCPPDQWFAFTPPRVPVLETAQQFLGSQTPVLMDIATAANFPCQRPFSEHLGVAELPEYRILPNLKQVVVSSNMWQSAEDGGPFLFTRRCCAPTACRPICATTGTATGARSNATTGWCPSPRRLTPSSTRAR